MSAAPSDQNIRAVLQRAAADPAFHMLLLNNREEALKDFPLSDAERNMLLSATATQLEKMVEQARHSRPPRVGTLVKIAAGVAAAGVVISLAIPST